ncbi:MAG: hypothetical protein J0M04_03790 [Verrucomicrobia bacterium]|nr:hypothetical protein [Verrucomicrobiota bacterium]
MKHRFKCPSCSRILETRKDLRGTEIQCGRCGQTFFLEESPKVVAPQPDAVFRESKTPNHGRRRSILETVHLLLIVCAGICFIGSIVKLERSDHEVEGFIDAQLPEHVYFVYARIRDEYGSLVAAYWRNVEYGDRGPAMNEFIKRMMNDADYRAMIMRAKNAGYQVPNDARRDEKIRTKFQWLRDNYSNLERRTTLTGRIGDALEYFGVGAMFVFAAMGVHRSIKKERQKNG